MIAQQTAEEATALIGWLNNHGKVRKIVDKAQGEISKDRMGYVIILAYVVANLTRWTTHCVTFIRLIRVKPALQLAVMQHRGALIQAQVGVAKSTEKTRLTSEATRFCHLIENHGFWNSLEVVVGDIEPICYGTNINQKDST